MKEFLELIVTIIMFPIVLAIQLLAFLLVTAWLWFIPVGIILLIVFNQ